MKFETLYKRAKDGSIQYWQIETRASDLAEGAQIRKRSGKLWTSKPLVHVEPIHQGKNIGKANETTPEQQADLQAKSDWTRKKDEGYKSLNDLGIIIVGPTEEAMASHWDSAPFVEYRNKLEELLQEKLPQFNSDANGNVKPMLATDWKKIKKIDYPVLVQPKLDGVRCLMIVRSTKLNPGTQTSIKFLSRSGKPYETLGHIAASILKYTTHAEEEVNFILDGEIYSDELTFQEIIQAVKKQYPNSLKLHFRAYDTIQCADMESDNQEDRVVAHTYNLVKKLNSPFIHYVPFEWAETAEEVEAIHDKCIQEGYEGVMIRLPQGQYEQGHRSRTLLKVKEFDESEFEFIQWEQGQREEDLLAVCKHGAHTFRAKMKGNRAEKSEMARVYPKKITVKHFGWTTDGLPRHPIGKAIRDYE